MLGTFVPFLEFCFVFGEADLVGKLFGEGFAAAEEDPNRTDLTVLDAAKDSFGGPKVDHQSLLYAGCFGRPQVAERFGLKLGFGIEVSYRLNDGVRSHGDPGLIAHFDGTVMSFG